MGDVTWTDIVRAIGSVITPIVVCFFGWSISQKIEKSKNNLLKEKEWQSKWADSFYTCTTKINDSIECIFMSLKMLSEADIIQPGDSQKFSQDMRENILHAIDTFRRCEWEIGIYIQFAPLNKQHVTDELTKLAAMYGDLIRTKHGDLDAIRNQLYQFNSSAKDAHRELLLG